MPAYAGCLSYCPLHGAAHWCRVSAGRSPAAFCSFLVSGAFAGSMLSSRLQTVLLKQQVLLSCPCPEHLLGCI